MLSSEQLDAAIKAQMTHHAPNQPEGHTGAINVGPFTECVGCGNLWPCQYVIQASISLKLTAIAAFLSGEFSVNQLMGGIVRGAQGNRDRFQKPKI